MEAEAQAPVHQEEGEEEKNDPVATSFLEKAQGLELRHDLQAASDTST